MFEPRPDDLKQLESKSITIDQLNEQVEIFKKGAPFAQLERACIPGDGIRQLSSTEQQLFIKKHQANQDYRVEKFVPASGAASRMFKHLHSYKNGDNSKLCSQFIANLESFPFYEELDVLLNHKTKKLIESGHWESIFKTILSPEGLNYGALPKALISFHKYNGFTRKALEEHLVEAAKYGKNVEGFASIHFTLSEQHISLVEELLAQVQKDYEDKYAVKYLINFSVQKRHTDTIAVDLDNKPFRNSDNSLLFRPGGHGALIENLNDLEADIAIIKNIDNVCREELQEETWKWKSILSGYVMFLDEFCAHTLKQFENDKAYPDRKEFNKFIQDHFGVNTEGFSDSELFSFLNKPIRVCGMVKNEGELGGGPFWVNRNGKVDCQIVEKAQIDMDNPQQAAIVQNSTHFNPVDLVCKLTNCRGERFNLLEHRDMDTVFISEKSKDGKSLKALELPGLWNGAMANWLTVFVEVPLITFNPVKTVNDLLKEKHLA